MSTDLRPAGLRSKLLVLLLAFGAIPVAVSIGAGYRVSRDNVIQQAEGALRELARAQAIHLAAELGRQQLVLRTIAGQLPPPVQLRRTESATLSRLLVQSLPEGGVFDGLRVVGSAGRVLVTVALRNTAPHWPPTAPATDWTERRVVVHREGAQVFAYLVAVATREMDRAFWLEGHVRAEDFRRVFAIPEHLMQGGEAAVFQPGGGVVVTGHAHAAEDLADALRTTVRDSARVGRAIVAGAPSLVAAVPVEGTDWIYITALSLEIALAPLTRLRNAALVGAGIFVIAIVITAAVAARSVTTPLSDLAAAARHFGRGGAHRPIVPRSRDEVGLLVESFNRMAADLARSRDEIERLHARDLERAHQLATVGELASGVAHEIRNPLTGVLGALDLALRRVPPEDAARPLLEEAQKQLRRIDGTTTQLLRYARPPELREVAVDAHRLVERAAQVLGPQASAVHVALQIEPAPDPVPVRADPEAMVQVLVNLMLNGIEAMSAGATLTVWVSRHAPEVWIGVRDTGAGIPPERRADVFRPFYTTKAQGTGLGLSISQQIVVRHGGSLRVEDTPGGGATLVVALPLAETMGREA